MSLELNNKCEDIKKCPSHESPPQEMTEKEATHEMTQRMHRFTPPNRPLLRPGKRLVDPHEREVRASELIEVPE